MAEGVENAENAPLFFNSKYEFGIDKKRRLQIPAKWKKVPGVTSLTLLVWKEKYLRALPPAKMRKMVKKLNKMPFADTRAESLRRILGANSDQVILDSASRICLPEKMAAAVGLKKRAVLIGVFDEFQIWDPERYTLAEAVDKELQGDAIQLFSEGYKRQN